MIKWAMVCLAAALVAAVMGFGGVSELAEVSQLLFMLCIAAFVALLIANTDRGRSR